MSFMDPAQTVALFGIQPSMKIADFGAGAGFFTILMAQAVGEGGQVTAVDVLDAALDAIRAQAKTENLSNINTVRSNLEVVGSSGLPSASQDIVLLKNVLFQSQKKTEIIQEAKRVLQPSGRLIIIDWQKGGGPGMTGGLGPPDELRSDEASVTSLVTANGFVPSNNFAPDTFHFGLIFKLAG